MHRNGELEFQFQADDPKPKLPILRDGQFQVVRWGNSRGQSLFLPRTNWTWLESVKRGEWQNCDPVPVKIPAILGCERGVWFAVKQGIRGILVPDERGIAVCYMLCEPSSHYFRIMTRSDRMPVMV